MKYKVGDKVRVRKDLHVRNYDGTEPMFEGFANDTHYAGDIQPIKLMEAQMSPEEFMGYLRGNIIKYCSRFGKKENADIEDEARKIQKYAEWLHEASKGDKITV